MSRAPDDHDDTGVTTVEVLFCTTTRNVVELDCRAVSGPGSGWPFTMTLGLPEHAAWAAAAERVLTRWAANDTLVTVSVRSRHRPAKVRLSDGEVTVLLDAVTAGSTGGVFR